MKSYYSTVTGLQKAALIFMIISTVGNAIIDYIMFPYLCDNLSLLSSYTHIYIRTNVVLYLILLLPLLYRIPMIICYFKNIKYGVEPIGCGFIVCNFLFLSPISAILMFIDIKN